MAYAVKYRGGVRVATGDVTGDGIPEIITVPGRSLAPTVKVWNLNGELLTSFDAYSPKFKKGVYVAVGDVVGDAFGDIVVTPSGGQSEVRVFENQPGTPSTANPTGRQFAYLSSRTFNAFPPTKVGRRTVNFVGGSTVAIGDVNGDVPMGGKSEILVGSGPGMRATIKTFSVQNLPSAGGYQPLNTYLPFATSFRGGVFVAAGDVNGDGRADIVAAAGPSGQSKVQVLNGDGAVLHNFTPFSVITRKSPAIRVAVADADGDGKAEIYVAQAADGRERKMRRFEESPTTALEPVLVDFLMASDLSFVNGYFLG
jgi:hypothetical protein